MRQPKYIKLRKDDAVTVSTIFGHVEIRSGLTDTKGRRVIRITVIADDRCDTGRAVELSKALEFGDGAKARSMKFTELKRAYRGTKLDRIKQIKRQRYQHRQDADRCKAPYTNAEKFGEMLWNRRTHREAAIDNHTGIGLNEYKNAIEQYDRIAERRKQLKGKSNG